MKVRITQPQTRIIPLSQWNEFHVWPTVPSMRRIIRIYGNLNGAIFRVGKRILVDEKLFFEWAKNKD